MYPGVDPKQLAKAQEVGKFIDGVIIVDYLEGTILLKLSSSNEGAMRAIPEMLESFSRGWGEQMYMLLAISGKIVERNKGKIKPT